MKKNALLAFCIIFSLAAKGFSQEKLPLGYKNIKFGMTVDEVKSVLLKDPNFGYRGDRDVSLLPGQNQVLIETDTSRNAPYSFLSRCYFQFHEEKLYIITLNMKASKMDHYSLYSALTQKYGSPTALNPEKTTWQDEFVTLTLERPLTVKYTDKKTFDQIQNESFVEKNSEEISREEFLKGL